MSTAKALIVSLMVQLLTFGYLVYLTHAYRDDNTGGAIIVAVLPVIAFLALCAFNLILFIVYTVLWASHKIQSYNPWVLILFLLVLGLTLCSPTIADWADGPIQYDNYGRRIPGQ